MRKKEKEYAASRTQKAEGSRQTEDPSEKSPDARSTLITGSVLSKGFFLFWGYCFPS
jgi:hypothetical protein